LTKEIDYITIDYITNSNIIIYSTGETKMKIWKILLIALITILILLGTLIWFSTKPLTREQAIGEIKKVVDSNLNKKQSVYSALVYLDAPQKGLEVKYAAGTLNGQPIDTNQPFHIASVGKLFTATLIGYLIDEGKVTLNDPIHLYLADDVLTGLFVYQGVDYKDQVTIQNLLSHTSGIADYFAKEDGGLVESLYLSPDTLYTPLTLVQFTREHQSAYFAPGNGYHYSDTGYVLLGLIIESVSGKSFDEMLHEVIFDPLAMNNSYLMFYSDPKNEKRQIADVWINGHEVSKFKSVSIDWAGGGIISTLDDLAVYIRALYQGEIISKETLDALNQFDHEFMSGIQYGNGFMRMEFDKFSPMLGFLPQMKGHMGVLGTQLFYDPETDMVYVSSFGSSDATANSVKTMIQILSIVYRVQ
jgi:D-alanyl-D-alanine carboxypeptidase